MLQTSRSLKDSFYGGAGACLAPSDRGYPSAQLRVASLSREDRLPPGMSFFPSSRSRRRRRQGGL
jgi:hypothetical protein